MAGKSSFKYSLAPSSYLDEFMKWQQGGAQGELPDFRDNIWASRGPGGEGQADDLRVILELIQRMVKPGSKPYEDMTAYLGGRRPPQPGSGTVGESYEMLYQLLGGGK